MQFFPGVLFLVTVQFYLTNDARENSNCSTSWNIVCYQAQNMRSDDAFARINLAWMKMIFYEMKPHIIGGHWFWVDSSEFWCSGAFWWRWAGKHLGWVRLGEDWEFLSNYLDMKIYEALNTTTTTTNNYY